MTRTRQSSPLSTVYSLSYGERHHQLSNSLTGSVRWIWEKLKIETEMYVCHLQNHIMVSPLSTKTAPTDTTYSYIQYMPVFSIEYGKMGRRVSLKYTGNNQAPFASQLITIPNLQNPLSTTVGNSNLKQEFTHNLSLYTDLTSLLSMQGNVAIYDNKITMFSIYDPMTGRMQLQYDNLDGNWNTSWKLAYNNFIKNVTIGGSISETYTHSTGYISETASGTPVRNNIDAHKITADANCRYGNKYILSWVNLTYSKDIRISRNQDNKINTDQLYLSLNCSYYHSSGLTCMTAIQYDWYKGYRHSSGSRNECKWNMEIEYTFLRGKRAAVSLGWYDILNNGSYLNEIRTDTEWTERWRKGKTSYALLKFAYKFKRII